MSVIRDAGTWLHTGSHDFSGATGTLMPNSVRDAQIPAGANIDPDKLASRSLAAFPLTALMWRVHDALGTLLGAAGNDDLGIYLGGTGFGTDAPVVDAGDLKAAGATTRYARTILQLPYNYEAAAGVRLVFHAGVLTTVADTTCTLDVEAFELDGDGGLVGSPTDLYTGAALDINNVTFADKSFTLTPTSLAPGDLIDVRIAIACNDGATGTVVRPAIGAAWLKCDVRG